MPDTQFSNDEIQQRAYEIYQARGATPGDPNADWQEAIRQLQQERSSQQKRSAFSWLNRPFVWLEKRAIEPSANWLDKADIFRIIEKISPIIEAIGVIAGAIIIPVVIWQVGDREQEAKEQQEKAIRAQTAVQNYLNQLSDILATGKLKTDEDLQTIVRASTLALLNNPDLQPDPELGFWENLSNDRKGQTIEYLSETGLVQVEVPEQSQNSKQADEPKKPMISLSIANLSGANLGGINLYSADLIGANLSNTFLIYTNLNRANLYSADLSCANLSNAILVGANLADANLANANLANTDFTYANFSNANLTGADLSRTNLSNARGWHGEQLAQAKLCNTNLPSGTNLDPDRDCKELGISPE